MVERKHFPKCDSSCRHMVRTAARYRWIRQGQGSYQREFAILCEHAVIWKFQRQIRHPNQRSWFGYAGIRGTKHGVEIPQGLQKHSYGGRSYSR